jgi:hypothetical protein
VDDALGPTDDRMEQIQLNLRALGSEDRLYDYIV